MAEPIENYALIGDCNTAALVGRKGAIDWLCWPRFDSDACFAALLGGRRNGMWSIRPTADERRVSRRYRDGTLVLETTFSTDGDEATLIDFMPLGDRCSHIVRIVVGKRGRMKFSTELVIRFGYGAAVPWVTRMEDDSLRAIAGPDMVVLRTAVKLRGENLRTVGDFEVAAGETVAFVLSYGASHRDPPQPIDPQKALAETEAAWRAWAATCHGGGKWAGAVTRSLLTLKALTYQPTGGIVAAPTTSLPELMGGKRNWDYRFCWLRDATLTLMTLMAAGYYEEAGAWRDWLLRVAAGSPSQMQIMYGIAGERRLTEWEVPWLDGYGNSKPVRIGNAAHGQLQLDVYGEIMDALHQARLGNLAPSEPGWAVQRALLDHLEKVWEQPDEGIWEVRGGRQQFTYSKVMAWVALDRAVKDAERGGLDGPIERWRALGRRIHADVCSKGFDSSRGSFVQAYGSRQLDASLLLLPAVGFLPPDDPRVQGTVRAIEEHLLVDGFVMRYDSAATEDGLPAGEGAFLPCSFWLVDARLMLGRRAEAERLFECLLGLCNDVGLLAEEYDPATRRLVGNFPQAFSHLALANSAYNLTRADKPAEKRAEKPAAAA